MTVNTQSCGTPTDRTLKCGLCSMNCLLREIVRIPQQVYDSLSPDFGLLGTLGAVYGLLPYVARVNFGPNLDNDCKKQPGRSACRS